MKPTIEVKRGRGCWHVRVDGRAIRNADLPEEVKAEIRALEANGVERRRVRDEFVTISQGKVLPPLEMITVWTVREDTGYFWVERHEGGGFDRSTGLWYGPNLCFPRSAFANESDARAAAVDAVEEEIARLRENQREIMAGEK